MPLLLDTHVVLWWLDDDDALDEAVKNRLDSDADVFVSAVSVWEIAIKQSIGKLSSDRNLAERARDCGFTALPIAADHAIAAAGLPLHHRDPFDRMLLGQALVERFTLMTRDTTLGRYGVPIERV